MGAGTRQLELLHPDQIYAALDKDSIIYVPLGAIEWHGRHLPIGLDSMTAHHVCLRVAEVSGGLVMPPLYYGMTGSIGHHPWTILLEKEDTFLSILRDTLKRLEDFGVELAVVFSGHFGRRQLAALNKLKSEWQGEAHAMRLLVQSINACPAAALEGDHGAIFETSLLAKLVPELVDLNKLPDVHEHPANDPEGNSWGDHRRDPDNVLFGILGDDPRHYDEKQAEKLLSTLTNWMIKLVEDEKSQIK
ncbi:MAG: creatininase family protein [Saprospiraceae bacterium]|nr:creatininase family protein [Saprospiraceae bacterium]